MFGTNQPEINNITQFAETDSRGKRIRFGIKDSDRTRHMYIIGQTGMGKSTLLENLAAQDILNNNGMCFIDPHGEVINTLLDYIPEHRVKDVVYFAPFDTQHPISFNVMENVDPDRRHLVAQGLLSAFKKIWGEETFSDRMEHIINNCLLALLEYPGSTILSMTRILTEAPYRKKVVDNITDPAVKAFWVNEFGSWDDRYRKEAGAAILNKIGQFTSNPLIRNIVGQEKSSFDFRQIMDNKKILLVNLSKGQVGEDNGQLLGAMLTTKVYLAAMSRADKSPAEQKKLPYFYLYVDEFQSVVNDSFASILSEARKYKLSLTIAHQYIEQMPDVVRAAVFGNVGTLISFRVGATDAEVLEKEFAEHFLTTDIVSLGLYQIYLKLMIDGVGSQPFSARTIAPIEKPKISMREEVIESSRQAYTKPRDEVEAEVASWMEQDKKATKTSDKPTSAKPYTKKPQAAGQASPIQRNTAPYKTANPKSFAANTQRPNKELSEEEKKNLEGESSFGKAFAKIAIAPKPKEATKNKESIPAKSFTKKPEVKSKPRNDLGDFLKQVT